MQTGTCVVLACYARLPAMKLGDWISQRGITPTDFARRIDRAPSTVTRLIAGDTLPDRDTVKRIFGATDGAVTPNDFFDLPDPGAGREPASNPCEAAE